MVRFIKVSVLALFGFAVAGCSSSSPSAPATSSPDGGTVDGSSAPTNTGFLECYLTIAHSDRNPPYTTHWCREQHQSPLESNCNLGGSMIVAKTESTTEHCPAPTTPSTSCELASIQSITWNYDIFAGIATGLTPAQLAMAEQTAVSIDEVSCRALHGKFTTYLVALDGGTSMEADGGSDSGAAGSVDASSD
jgi:hypothetical protein